MGRKTGDQEEVGREKGGKETGEQEEEEGTARSCGGKENMGSETGEQEEEDSEKGGKEEYGKVDRRAGRGG